MAWLFLWQHGYLTLSVPVMFVLLATLVLIYLRLDIGKSTMALRERLAVHLPFSFCLGRVTIATIIVVSLLVTLLVVAMRTDIAYALVSSGLCWVLQ